MWNQLAQISCRNRRTGGVQQVCLRHVERQESTHQSAGETEMMQKLRLSLTGAQALINF